MSGPETAPIRSGFCNPSNDKASHARCRKEDCPCEHHTAAVGPAPCRCWTQRALPHEGHCCMRAPDGDLCHQLEGLALYAAAQTTVGRAS